MDNQAYQENGQASKTILINYIKNKLRKLGPAWLKFITKQSWATINRDLNYYYKCPDPFYAELLSKQVGGNHVLIEVLRFDSRNLSALARGELEPPRLVASVQLEPIVYFVISQEEITQNINIDSYSITQGKEETLPIDDEDILKTILSFLNKKLGNTVSGAQREPSFIIFWLTPGEK